MSSRPPRDLWAPISVWGHVWRGLLAAVTGTLLFLVSNDPQVSRPLASWVPFVDLVVGVLSLVLLPLHRRSPLLVPVLLQAMTAVSTSSAGSASVALVSVATRRRWPRIALAGVVAMLASLAVSRIYPEIDPMPTALNVATMVLVLAAQIAWGLYLGARRDLFATWQWRAETAEREQVQRISSAREAERTRIAREMHDVLAHRISLVSMHAGALAYRDDLSRERIREEATIIQGTSMQALTELRQILGVLRSTPVGEPQDAVEAPQPTFTDIGDLVEEACAAGLPASLTVEVPSGLQPPRRGRSACLSHGAGGPDQRAQARAGRPDPGGPAGRAGVGPAPGGGQRARARMAFAVGLPRRRRARPGRPHRARDDRRRRAHARRRRRRRLSCQRGSALAPGGLMTDPVCVLLVDDDALVRAGLRLMLGGDASLDVVGEAGDGLEAERLVGELRPAVVLMDIRMPRQDGLTTTEHLVARPGTPR